MKRVTLYKVVESEMLVDEGLEHIRELHIDNRYNINYKHNEAYLHEDVEFTNTPIVKFVEGNTVKYVAINHKAEELISFKFKRELESMSAKLRHSNSIIESYEKNISNFMSSNVFKRIYVAIFKEFM